jgi:protein ImuB
MIGLFRASAQPEHLFQLLQMRLERWILRSPVRSLELAIKLTAPLQVHQRGLFGDPYDHQQQLSLLIDRLSSRLQREAVVYAIPVSDAQPEYAYRYAPLTGSHPRLSARKKSSGKKSPGLLLPPTDLIDGSEAPGEKASLAQLIRPVLLELTPLPLEVLTTTRDGIPLRFRVHRELYERNRVWGPERIQTGWWRHKYIRRDYYRIETTTGNRFWLFCSKRRWYLHGVFD